MIRKVLIVAAAVATLLLVQAGPAAAQFIPATVDADFDCDEAGSEHVITLTIDVPAVGGTPVDPGGIEVTASPGDPQIVIDPFDPDPVDPGEVSAATITVEGDFTGNVDWTFNYVEAGQTQTAEGNVEFGETCLAPTTTTQPTTTTTAPRPATPAPAVTVTPTFTG